MKYALFSVLSVSALCFPFKQGFAALRYGWKKPTATG